MAISVFAPASIGNVSVGFDVLGAAITPIDGTLLGDVVTIELCEPSQQNNVELEVSGSWANKLPTDYKLNIVVMCAHYYLEHVVKNPHSIIIKLTKNLPVGSGLGSSASSIVAALHALNIAFDKPLDDDALLTLMGEFEGSISGSIHYDNVAPCFLGGLQLMLEQTQQISTKLPVFEDWYWVVAYSGNSLSTEKMRALVPDQLSTQKAIQFGQNLASFVHACYQKDETLAASCIKDVIAEPYRASTIPGYQQAIRTLVKLDVLASGISGSGPTMFAIANDLGKAKKLQATLNEVYVKPTLGGFSHLCKIDMTGSRVLAPEVS